jgi:GNAT superfamily N-acetyltransferase
MVDIRKALVADAAAILDVRCAEEGGVIVGFVIVGPCHEPDPDPTVTRELYQIHVAPERFRDGVGSALHSEAVGKWRTERVDAARLWAWEFNARARAFYESRGWIADGHVRHDDPRIGDYRMLGYRLALS